MQQQLPTQGFQKSSCGEQATENRTDVARAAIMVWTGRAVLQGAHAICPAVLPPAPLPAQLDRASLELLERLDEAGSQRAPVGPQRLLRGPSVASISSSAK